jgi:putative transcriptional regulator
VTAGHHASDETLARFAWGRLPPGPALVVAAHLWNCARCRSAVRGFEAAGSVMLEDLEPVPVETNALERALVGLESAERTPAPLRRGPKPRAALGLQGVEMPPPLAGLGAGRWRWLGPGVRASWLGGADESGAGILLLRVKAGRALPLHGHTGTEWSYVVHGFLSDARGRFGPGDLIEMDEDVEHQPVVDTQGECLCVAAIEGKMMLRGTLARVFQSLAGF